MGDNTFCSSMTRESGQSFELNPNALTSLNTTPLGELAVPPQKNIVLHLFEKFSVIVHFL